ncbi:Dehydrogenase/reductase SDR family member 4 [Aphelenchoides fujianensis]|nr:Dehydrogenase/reductase SDR family member 4 [Aphelenchoides fujianensis]
MTGVKFLTESVAVVTASTKGIGFAIARRLGLDGAKVVVSSRKEANVRVSPPMRSPLLQMEGIDCAGCTAHVGVAEDRRKLLEFALDRYNKLDVLVSNAGVSPHYGDLLDVSDSQWEKLLNVNVKSAFLLTQEAIPHLEKSENASVVFVSSVAGYAPLDGIGAYSIMKSALNGVTKSLSQSLARRNIRVNAIAPGIIRTDFSKMITDAEEGGMDPNKVIPLGRFGEAEECAGAVAFLASTNAAYLTGETIGINGGMQARV